MNRLGSSQRLQTLTHQQVDLVETGLVLVKSSQLGQGVAGGAGQANAPYQFCRQPIHQDLALGLAHDPVTQEDQPIAALEMFDKFDGRRTMHEK